jgi:hypothetical protein
LILKPRAKEVGTLVGTRFQSELLDAVDAWRKEQSDLPSRPEAVRRLVALGMVVPIEKNTPNKSRSVKDE